MERRFETSGACFPGYEVRVIDPNTGREQPDDVPGELLVRGEYLMQGYHKKPDETAAC